MGGKRGRKLSRRTNKSNRPQQRGERTAPADRRARSNYRFLCDADCTRDICALVSAIPGFRTTHVFDIGMTRSGDSGIKNEAVRRNAIILTLDSDFTDPVNFTICTHPGVLYLNMSEETTSHIKPRLQRFLLRYARRCKHAVVELQDSLAIIRSTRGQREITF